MQRLLIRLTASMSWLRVSVSHVSARIHAEYLPSSCNTCQPDALDVRLSSVLDDRPDHLLVHLPGLSSDRGSLGGFEPTTWCDAAQASASYTARPTDPIAVCPKRMIVPQLFWQTTSAGGPGR